MPDLPLHVRQKLAELLLGAKCPHCGAVAPYEGDAQVTVNRHKGEIVSYDLRVHGKFSDNGDGPVVYASAHVEARRK